MLAAAFIRIVWQSFWPELIATALALPVTALAVYWPDGDSGTFARGIACIIALWPITQACLRRVERRRREPKAETTK